MMSATNTIAKIAAR